HRLWWLRRDRRRAMPRLRFPAGHPDAGTSVVLPGHTTGVRTRPKLRDLEHVNLHDDLGKCRRQRSHVLTTRHRPERRPSRPVKIIDTQRGTRSALAPGLSVYVLTPISGVFPGHCPFSADTPT